MLQTEASPNDSSTAAPRGTVELRVHSATGGERLVPLGAGKHTVGSGPRCTIRLEQPGVRPLQCLIVNDAIGLHVRRWADNMLLNGGPFDEAELVAGDTLSLGSVELEVVAPTLTHESTQGAMPTASRGSGDHDKTDMYMATPSSPPAADGTQDGDAVSAAAAARGRRRTLRAALRRQRAEHNRLIERVGDLEQKIGCLLAERQGVPADDLEETVLDDEQPDLGPANEPVETDADSPPVECPAESGGDWLTDARAALARDRAPWGQTGRGPAPSEVERLSSELSEANEQLAERDARLAEVQAHVRDLDQQLLDSRRVMQCFADERSGWQKQLADVESRVSGYLSRIHELETQLVEARTAEVTWPAVGVQSADPIVAAAQPVAEVPSTFEWTPPAVEVPPLEWQTYASESLEAPPTDAPPELESAAVPAAEAVEPAAPASETDLALAKLRELSIWREEPVEDEEIAAVTQPERQCDETLTVDEAGCESTEAPPATPPAEEPQSYIERYAHLFDGDEAASDSLTASTDVAESSPPPPETTHPPAIDEHEQSIEEYMAKLMERVRGSSAADAARPMARENAEVDSAIGDEPTAAEEESQAPLDAAGMKAMPRALAAERGTDMGALRALANESARHAIGVHAAGKMRRNASTRFIVALLAGVTALFFALRAPSWESLEFVTAAIAALAALYWSQETFRALVSAVRVGAFYEPEKEDFAAVDGGGIPLPIDVRR